MRRPAPGTTVNPMSQRWYTGPDTGYFPRPLCAPAREYASQPAALEHAESVKLALEFHYISNILTENEDWNNILLTQLKRLYHGA